MKKFSKILVFALSLVIAVSAFAIASSAETSPFLVEGLYRESWEEAIDNSYIKGDRVVPVELLRDYESDGESVEITKSVVISLNGHTLTSESSSPLFNVIGEDTTLTIVGPGTIVVNGTLANVESGNLLILSSKDFLNLNYDSAVEDEVVEEEEPAVEDEVVEATPADKSGNVGATDTPVVEETVPGADDVDEDDVIKIVSSGSDNVFVIGSEEKAFVSVLGKLEFESGAGASLFELLNGSKFSLTNENSIVANPTSTATEPFGIVFAGPSTKIEVKNATIKNSGGYIFKVSDEADADTSVEINCESATLVSDSRNFGSVVEAGAGYADVVIRLNSLVEASGAAFVADNTLFDVIDGEGRDKVYAKPTLKVNFITSVYRVSAETENNKASLFYGNVTGIVTASEIWNSETSAIGFGTRLWDGECGVLIKKGCSISLTSTIISSETSEYQNVDGEIKFVPLKDADGARIYFTPGSTTNKNFSLEVIDGKPCEIYKTTTLGENNFILDHCVVSDKITPFVDTKYSSDFEDENQSMPIAPSNMTFGEKGRETIKHMLEDGTEKSNKFYQWEYDANKKDQYSHNGSQSYFDLSAGGASGTTRGFDAVVNNEIITWDFDIASSNGVYDNASIKIFIREKTGSYKYTKSSHFSITYNDGKKEPEKKGYYLGSVRLPDTPYEWTHVTFVMDMDLSGAYTEKVNDKDVTYYPNLYKSIVYLFINGEYEGETTLFDGEASLSDAAGIKKTPELSLNALRFGVSYSKDTSESLCFDNSIITYYPAGYEGLIKGDELFDFEEKANEYYNYVEACKENGEPVEKTLRDYVGNLDISLADVFINKYSINLKETCDAVYKKGYYTPLSKEGFILPETDDRVPVANVDGANYFSVEEVIKAISEGSVIKLYQDVDVVFSADMGFTVFTAKDGGGNYRFNFVSNTYYPTEIYENGVLVAYKTVPASSLVTIYWQINTGYQTKAAIGTVPEYNGVKPTPYDNEQRYRIELIGWSTDKNATEPEELTEITKYDIERGYRIYYPVIGVSSVPVTFLDAYGKPIKEMMVDSGTSEAKLKRIFDASDVLPAFSIEGNDWFEQSFSGWKLEGGVVGRTACYATPVFSEVRIKDSAIKVSYSLVKLVEFSPSVYLLKPDANALPADELEKIEFLGFSKDGKAYIEGTTDVGNQYVYNDVNIGGKTYHKLNVTKTSDSKKISELGEFPIYIVYEYDGEKKTQRIDLSINAYLEAVMKAAKTDADKKPVLEIMRLGMTYLELAGKTNLETYTLCKGYVDTYSSLLSDYTKVMDLVPKEKKDKNSEMLDGFHEHFESVEWNFVSNTLLVKPRADKYPNLSDGYSPAKDNPDGRAANFVQACSVGATSGSKRLGQSLQDLNGKSQSLTINGNGRFSFSWNGGSKDYGWPMVTACESETEYAKAADSVYFPIFGPAYYYINKDGKEVSGRDQLGVGYYNLTAHITELESQVKEDPGRANELKMAKVILATQLAVKAACAESGADIKGVVNTPVASLSKR